MFFRFDASLFLNWKEAEEAAVAAAKAAEDDPEIKLRLPGATIDGVVLLFC